MKTFVTALRQDLIAIRWILIAWLVTTLVLQSLPTSILDHAPTRNLIDYVRLFSGMTWLVLVCVLFARIALGHSPVDPHNGWRTRPLRPAMVAVEKLGVCAFVFITPAIAIAATGQTSPPLREISYALLVALFIASLVPSSRALIAALGIVGALAAAAVGFFLNRSVSFLLQLYNDTGALLAQCLLVVGLVGLIIRQYVRPHSTVHAAAAVGLFGVIASLSWVFPHPGRPVPFLDRPEARVALVSARPLTDDEMIGGAYFNYLDRRYAENFGKPRSHRNWAVRLALAGLRDDELWFVRFVYTNHARRHRFMSRSKTPPIFLSTQNLLRELGLSDYTFVEPVDHAFDYQFNWANPEGRENFPEAPIHDDFELLLLRIDDIDVLTRAPLAVGDYGDIVGENERSLSISRIDWTNRRIEGHMAGPLLRLKAPGSFSMRFRYSALMLVAYNPNTQEAGYVEQIPPTRFERVSRFEKRDNLYQLPDLAGDPRDWQLLVFLGIADRQLFVTGNTPEDESN